MLRSMSEHTLMDKIQKKDIRKGLGVSNIKEKIKENCLRWFEDLQRRSNNELVRKIKIWRLGARET